MNIIIKFCLGIACLLTVTGCGNPQLHIYHYDHNKSVYGGIRHDELYFDNDYDFYMLDDINIDRLLTNPTHINPSDIINSIDVRTIITTNNGKHMYLGYNYSKVDRSCVKIVIYDNVYCDEGSFDKILDMVEKHIAKHKIISKSVISSMHEIGSLFEKNEISESNLKAYINQIHDKPTRQLFIEYFKSKGIYP